VTLEGVAQLLDLPVVNRSHHELAGNRFRVVAV